MNFFEKIKKDKEEFLAGIGLPEQGVFKPDKFQLDAIESAVSGVDTLVVAPTGSGKTYIALQAIAATLALGCRAIYTTPLKALSNSKYNDLKNRFEPQYKVGILTGDRKIDTDASAVIATTEIYRNELYNGNTNYSLVVLDEVHYIADAQRGAVWEEAILLTPRDTTLLMLSASISNHQEIAAWLKSVRGRECRVVIATERPVALRLGFLHPEYGILPLRDSHQNVNKLVADYYGSSKLDSKGMRLKPKQGFRGPRRQKSRR